jgi:hypothetical protein
LCERAPKLDCLSTVIAGLDPAIHDEVQHAMKLVSFSAGQLIMDARVKPAHDAEILAKAV